MHVVKAPAAHETHGQKGRQAHSGAGHVHTRAYHISSCDIPNEIDLPRALGAVLNRQLLVEAAILKDDGVHVKQGSARTLLVA